MKRSVQIRINAVITAVLVALSSLNIQLPVFAENESDIVLNYDFSAMTALPLLNNGAVDESYAADISSSVTLSDDGGVQALKWQRNHTQDATAAKMELQLSKAITAEDFPIMLEYSARLDNRTSRHWGNFALAGVDLSNNAVKSLYGATAWYSYAPLQLRFMEEKSSGNIIGYGHWSDGNFTTAIKYNGSVLDANRYYVHRYVINADGTYSYKIREDTANAKWENIYSDYKLRTLTTDATTNNEEGKTNVANHGGKLPAVITSLYSQAGFLSVGDTRASDDLTTDKIDYYRYIRIKKNYDGDVFANYDFSQITSLPAYVTTDTANDTAAENMKTELCITDDGEANVLEWKRNHIATDTNTANGTAAQMEISLSKPITASDFPIILEYSAKLDGLSARAWGNFALKGTDASGNEVKSLYGVTKWYSYAPFQLRYMEDENGGIIGYGNYATEIKYRGKALDSTKFYIHRYIINSDGTYTYKIKEDKPGAQWQAVHGDYKLRTLTTTATTNGESGITNVANYGGKLPQTITSLYSEAGYLMVGEMGDTQKVDMASEKLDCFKYIKVFSAAEATIDIGPLKDAIYASANGRQNAAGTIDDPVSGINEAVDLYKEIKEMSGYTPQIYVLGGDYYLSETIYIDKSASGLKITPYNGDEVNIYGMHRISEDNVSIAQSSDCGGRLPENLVGKILKIDLSDIPDEKLTPTENYNENAADHVNYRDNQENENLVEIPYNCELFDNNKIQTIARWPDKGWAFMGDTTQHDGTSATFVTENSLNWDKNADDILIRNFRPYEYHCLQGDITGFDTDENTVSMYQEFHDFPIYSGLRYYFFNIPEEISQKGEYYIDYDEKAAYYYPENKDSLDDIAITILTDGIIRIEDNSSDVSIEGLNFVGSRGNAITAYNSENIDVKACDFAYTGDCAVFLPGCIRCDITQNTYDNIGNISVYVRGGDVASLTSGENTITESRFTNGARIGKTYTPFILADGVGALIEHNYFYNHMQAAILFNGNNNIIQKNIFDTVVTETLDAGAIYSGRKTTKWGNVIKNNIFKNIKNYKSNAKSAVASAVYIDDTMPGTSIEDNLFYNCSSPINIGGGVGTKISGNLMYDCVLGVSDYYRSVVPEWFNKDGKAWKWINAVIGDNEAVKEKWFTQYPHFEELYNDLNNETVITLGNSEATVKASHLPKNTQIFDNLFVCETVKDSDNGGMNSVTGISGEILNLIRGKWQVSGTAYDITPSGKYENNYVNDDLSNVIIDGKTITINDKLFTQGYLKTDGYNGFLNDDGLGETITAGTLTAFTPPDVSDAGPTTSEIDLSGIPTADEGVYKTQVSRKNYSDAHAFRADSFDNYSSGNAISEITAFDATAETNPGILGIYASSVAFDGAGKVAIKGSSKYTAKLNLVPDTDFDDNCALYLKLSGSTATITLTSSQGTFEDTQATGDIEYRLADGVLKKYTLSDGEWVISSTNALDAINKITITADVNETVYLDYISLNKIGNNPEVTEYFNLDFEDAINAQSAASYEEIELYNASADTTETIMQESADNKALLVSQSGAKRTVDILEMSFDPIYTKHNVITFEYSIKLLSDIGRLLDVCQVLGFDSSKPSAVVETDVGGVLYPPDGPNLYYNNEQIAYTSQLKEDFIRIKVELDAVNSEYKVYKFSNGEWVYKLTVTDIAIPEYVDKIQFTTHGPDSDWGEDAPDRQYLIDDIKIYDGSALYLKASDESIVNEVNKYRGQSLFIKPQYHPATQIGTVIGAVYDGSGKLCNVNLKNYAPDTQIELEIPSDEANNYNIKYFQWEDANTLKPIGKTKQFN